MGAGLFTRVEMVILGGKRVSDVRPDPGSDAYCVISERDHDSNTRRIASRMHSVLVRIGNLVRGPRRVIPGIVVSSVHSSIRRCGRNTHLRYFQWHYDTRTPSQLLFSFDHLVRIHVSCCL